MQHVTTIAIANVAAAMLIGFDRMAHYYLKIGSSVSEFHQAYYFNFSLWTIGWRIFDGTGSQVLGGVNAPPLFNAPAIAPFISIAISFAMLICGLAFAFQARCLDTSFGILICLMILVSPVAWDHYLIPALIPLVIVAHNLISLKPPGPAKERDFALHQSRHCFSLSRRYDSIPLFTQLYNIRWTCKRTGFVHGVVYCPSLGRWLFLGYFGY